MGQPIGGAVVGPGQHHNLYIPPACQRQPTIFRANDDTGPIASWVKSNFRFSLLGDDCRNHFLQSTRFREGEAMNGRAPQKKLAIVNVPVSTLVLRVRGKHRWKILDLYTTRNRRTSRSTGRRRVELGRECGSVVTNQHCPTPLRVEQLHIKS